VTPTIDEYGAPRSITVGLSQLTGEAAEAWAAENATTTQQRAVANPSVRHRNDLLIDPSTTSDPRSYETVLATEL
jgi:hypothetical protein